MWLKSCRILLKYCGQSGQILHIVAGCDSINVYIITAYYPDTNKFENDLKYNGSEMYHQYRQVL